MCDNVWFVFCVFLCLWMLVSVIVVHVFMCCVCVIVFRVGCFFCSVVEFVCLCVVVCLGVIYCVMLSGVFVCVLFVCLCLCV